MSDIHFQGIWRMDWGLGNPNKTAALIALLMIAVWALAFMRKGKGKGNWGFWAALAPFTGLGICLIHTMSRGGLIAFFAGLVPLLLMAPRPWPRNKVLALVALAWIILGASLFLNAHLRYEQGILHEDRSITNRFQLWKAAPRMMVDAPEGWGLGKSGAAYMEWYQPLSSKEGYRTLVNSHLTWLVEMGWPLRFAYLLGWGAIFLLCWPGRERRWFAIPLGIWIALAVAASFSSVAESPWLWILPIASLLAVLGYRVRYRVWSGVWCWMIPASVAALLCGLCYAIGASHQSLIHRQGNILIFGKGAPQEWLLPDAKILGKSLGRALRRTAEHQQTPPPALALLLDADHLPSLKEKRVLIVGNPASHDQLERVFREAAFVTLVNPGFLPQEVGMTTQEAPHAALELVVGEFSQSPAAEAWKQILPLRILSGVGDYIPDWSSLLFPLKDGMKPLK